MIIIAKWLELMILTNPSVHVTEAESRVMELAIFDESPELESSQNKSVVWIIVMAKATVEQVDLVQASHVTHYDEQHL